MHYNIIKCIFLHINDECYRCVQTHAYNSLTCTRETNSKELTDQSCEINKNSRKHCRACRWERCIKAGKNLNLRFSFIFIISYIKVLIIFYSTIFLGMKISYVQFDTKINGSNLSFSDNLTQILQE